MTDGERYQLRELSSYALALSGRLDVLGGEVRKISGLIDDLLIESRPKSKRNLWTRWRDAGRMWT